jgi:hypothetical protein
MSLHLIDVTGRAKYFVNLSLVQRIQVEDYGEHADVTFTYASGDEGIFKVPSGRLVVLLDQIVKVPSGRLVVLLDQIGEWAAA